NQQIAQLSQERDEAKNQLAAAQQENEQWQNNEDELLRLRGEVGVLRRQLDELAGKNLAWQNTKAATADSNTNSFPPPLHIKARFLTVPKDTLAGLGIQSSDGRVTGVLTSENTSRLLSQLQAIDGVEELAEPEVVTTGGRQTELRAT